MLHIHHNIFRTNSFVNYSVCFFGYLLHGLALVKQQFSRIHFGNICISKFYTFIQVSPDICVAFVYFAPSLKGYEELFTTVLGEIS